MISTSGPISIKEEFLRSVENLKEKDKVLEAVSEGLILVLEHEWWFLYQQDPNVLLTQLAVTFNVQEEQPLITEEQKLEENRIKNETA